MTARIPLSKPIITKDMIEAAIHALQNEKLVLGESVYKFEEEFARYVGVRYAVAVNSGTSALILAYYAVGLKPGTGFIVPSATFISTASSGALVGGSPIFVDISLEDYTVDVSRVEQVLKNPPVPVRAVVPVHLYGYPAEVKPILELAEERGVYVIEDAAQAHGAIYRGRRVGSWGHVAVFSFYPIKNMTVGGDGGMLVTDDEEVAEVARKLRDCGRRSKYVHDMLGYVFRMNTVNAAIGRVQLRYLDTWNERRRQIAALYDKELSQLDEVKTPPRPTRDKVPVYHLYVIRLPSRDVRNALGAWLYENGVETLIHYPVPLHRQPAFAGVETYRVGGLENTEVWADTVLSLPMHPELTRDEVGYVCEKIYEFFDKGLHRDSYWRRRGAEWLKRYM